MVENGRKQEKKSRNINIVKEKFYASGMVVSMSYQICRRRHYLKMIVLALMKTDAPPTKVVANTFFTSVIKIVSQEMELGGTIKGLSAVSNRQTDMVSLASSLIHHRAASNTG